MMLLRGICKELKKNYLYGKILRIVVFLQLYNITLINHYSKVGDKE